MSEEEELVLRATIRDELSAPLQGIRAEVRGAGHDADIAGRRAGTASRGFGLLAKAGRAAGLALKIGFAGVLAAGYAGFRLVRSALGEAREAQKVGALTRAELKATGAQSWITARQIDRLSSSISRKAGIDDEAIATGANLLLTFKQIRNETGKGNDVFNRATKSAVNLAAAGFGSIESGSKMLGKALNDPLKGVTALSRAGVTFSEQQVKTISYMVEHNRLLDAQKIILGEVESQVGGAAAATATWGDKASVMWGNMQERLGTALLPLLDRVSRWFVQDGGPALDRYIGLFEHRGVPVIEKYADLFVRRGIPAARDFLDEVRPLAESVLPTMGTALHTIKDAIVTMAPKLAKVFDGFNDLPDWAKTAIMVGAGAGAVGSKLGLFSKGGGLAAAFTAARPLPVIVMNPGGLPTTPGVPVGAPGGSPKVPPVLPTASRGLLTRLFTGTALGITALGAGVTYASKDGVIPFDGKVQTEKEFFDQLKRDEADRLKSLDQLLVAPLGKTKELRSDWEFLTGNPAKPKIDRQGMAGAIDDGNVFLGLLGQVDAIEARPRVTIDATAAMAAINAIRDAMAAVSDFGGGFLSGDGKAPATDSDTDWSVLEGGPPKHHHDGKGKGKGGKHGRPLATPHGGRTDRPGFTVADGAFPTTIQTSARDLDPAELRDAWEQFLGEWLRDREEAGAL